jgi:hypothetical protein
MPPMPPASRWCSPTDGTSSTDMDARTIAAVDAAGRVVMGGALALQPRRTASAWIGRAGGEPGAQMLAAAAGVRDAAIGVGLLSALRRGDDPRPWVAAGVAADLVDLVGTLRGGRDMPPLAVAGVAVLAAGSAALGAWLYAALD